MSGQTVPCILNLDTRWERMVRLTPWPFNFGGIMPRYPFCSGPRSSLAAVNKRNISSPSQLSNSNSSVIQDSSNNTLVLKQMNFMVNDSSWQEVYKLRYYGLWGHVLERRLPKDTAAHPRRPELQLHHCDNLKSRRKHVLTNNIKMSKKTMYCNVRQSRLGWGSDCFWSHRWYSLK